MVIFLYGSDTFRSLRKLKELKEKFLKDVKGGYLNLLELDGEKLTFADFKKAISTVSFMSSKRMVIFKNIISKGKGKNLQKEIVEFLKKDGDNENVIIFWEEEKNEKEALFKYLGTRRDVPRPLQVAGSLQKSATPCSESGISQHRIYRQEFGLLKGMALRTWITKAVQEKGGNIGSQAVNMLMEMIGSDLWQMNNELDKLISFSSEISQELVKKFIKTKDDENIFNLTDAIGNRNKKLALKLLAEQLRVGVNINYIITMLARQFRVILEIKDYLAKEAESSSPYNISRDLGMQPFVARKLLEQVRKYETENLKKLHSEILEIDLKSKTSSANKELLLDMIIVSA